MSGLMMSPSVDDWNYVQTIPARLQETGLHIPNFICLESPFPGTPYFQRLATDPRNMFLPNALLRDFNGYTLVVRPERESVDDFIGQYKWVLDATYTKRRKAKKLAEDLPTLFASGVWESAMVDIVHQCFAGYKLPCPGRTYLAGSDVPPPEDSQVPFQPDDFDSEREYHAVMDPWRVTDEAGRVLPAWTGPTRVFERNGRISAQALQFVGVVV
jgi:hypothetical protein